SYVYHPDLHSFPTRRSSDLRPDRFILTPGQKAVADFSACLNNDRFLNNDEVSVSYKSNDPSVVKVDDKGNITAIKPGVATVTVRSEEHTSELQSRENLVCRL